MSRSIVTGIRKKGIYLNNNMSCSKVRIPEGINQKIPIKQEDSLPQFEQ